MRFTDQSSELYCVFVQAKPERVTHLSHLSHFLYRS